MNNKLKTIDVNLNILPHFRDIFNDKAKIKVIAKGRRSGATHNCVLYLIERCLIEKGKRYLWIDTHIPSIESYIQQYFLPALRQIPSELWVYKQKKIIIEINDNIILFRSAENVKSIEGDKFNLICINEAGFLLKSHELFENSLLVMTMDTKGDIIINGTPRGGVGTYYEKLYRKGYDDHPEYNPKYLKSFMVYPFQNSFVDPVELKRMIMGMDEHSVKQEIFGEFIDLAGIPFYYNFNREIHVDKNVVYNPELGIELAFDFNIDNQATLVFQHDTKTDTYYCIEEIINSGGDIEMTCDIIKKKYSIHHISAVYGDASGGYRTGLMRGVTYWNLIKQNLGLQDHQIRLPRKNPDLLDAKLNINWVLKKKDIHISSSCLRLIDDLVKVQTDTEGKIDKSDVKLTHYSDAFRYYFYYKTYNEFYNIKKSMGINL